MSYRAGSQFGATHAECIFVSAPNTTFLKSKIEKTRNLISQQGRDPSGVKFFLSFTPILAATNEEAQHKLAQLQEYSIPEGSLAKFAAITGINLSNFGLDDELPTGTDDPRLAGFSEKQKEILIARPQGYERWTPRIFSQWSSIGGSGPIAVGTGPVVAGELERWIYEADVDGFNLGHVAVPQSWEDIVTFLIPELRERGWLGADKYAVPGGTLRENLRGLRGNGKIDHTHPATNYKFR